jgi:hypothetical protein
MGTFGTRLRCAVSFAMIASLVLVAAGCKKDVTKEVLFVNDSVTHYSIPAIVDEMNLVSKTDSAGRYAPNFGSSVPTIGLRYVPGLATPAEIDDYWTGHLTTLIEHVQPEVIIVELGYNDCTFEAVEDGLTTYGEDIDRFMDNVPAATPVHWLTLADVNNAHTCDETINAALNDATTRWPNLLPFDFATFMQGHTEWAPDGTHLSTAGQKAYASWLRDQLDARYLAP